MVVSEVCGRIVSGVFAKVFGSVVSKVGSRVFNMLVSTTSDRIFSTVMCSFTLYIWPENTEKKLGFPNGHFHFVSSIVDSHTLILFQYMYLPPPPHFCVEYRQCSY